MLATWAVREIELGSNFPEVLCSRSVTSSQAVRIHSGHWRKVVYKTAIQSGKWVSPEREVLCHLDFSRRCIRHLVCWEEDQSVLGIVFQLDYFQLELEIDFSTHKQEPTFPRSQSKLV